MFQPPASMSLSIIFNTYHIGDVVGLEVKKGRFNWKEGNIDVTLCMVGQYQSWFLFKSITFH